jgi:hypothetical protein
MCRSIHRALQLTCRTEGQAAPEYAVVLAVVLASSAFLFADLGNRIPSIVSAVEALLS